MCREHPSTDGAWGQRPLPLTVTVSETKAQNGAREAGRAAETVVPLTLQPRPERAEEGRPSWDPAATPSCHVAACVSNSTRAPHLAEFKRRVSKVAWLALCTCLRGLTPCHQA